MVHFEFGVYFFELEPFYAIKASRKDFFSMQQEMHTRSVYRRPFCKQFRLTSVELEMDSEFQEHITWANTSAHWKMCDLCSIVIVRFETFIELIISS